MLTRRVAPVCEVLVYNHSSHRATSRKQTKGDDSRYGNYLLGCDLQVPDNVHGHGCEDEVCHDVATFSASARCTREVLRTPFLPFNR